MKKIIIALGLFSTVVSCQKEFDSPEITFPTEGSVITMDSLLNLFSGYPIKFEDNLSMYATVTMDETDGNVYKSVYLQDGTKAINLRLLSGGGLYVGDSIRIDLKGTILNQYNGVMQLDSVDIDKNIVKQEVNVHISPLVVTLDQLNTNLQSRLIKIENVQFIKPQISSTYADGTNQISYDITLEDINGNTATVRNSGYANFANESLAQGSGSITCIVGVFGNNVQLLVRSFDEINMTGNRFPGILHVKNFDDGNISTNGWQQYSVLGNDIVWETSSAGGAATDYVQISNFFNSSNVDTENWLISETFDLSNVNSPQLNFNSAFNYSGPTLEVLVSTNYDGISNPNTATWIALAPALSSGSWAWLNSGNVDLSAYTSSNVHIAFKYTGSSSNGSTWELDDIKIIG